MQIYSKLLYFAKLNIFFNHGNKQPRKVADNVLLKTYFFTAM